MRTPEDLKEQDTAPSKRDLVNTNEEKSLPPETAAVLESVRHPAILLLGRTGAGKSTFGNWLLGFDGGTGPFPTRGNSDSVTEVCRTKLIKIKDRTFNLIDTPGIFDPDDDVLGKKSLDKIADAINLCSYGIQAIIFVVEKNLIGDSSKTMKIISGFLGDQALEYMIVAFTYCSREQTTNDQQLQRALSSKMKEFLTSVNNRHVVSPHPDMFHKDDDAVRKNIEKVKHLIDNFRDAYTTEMFNKIREARESAIDRLLMTEEEMLAAMNRAGREEALREASTKCFKLDTKVILEIGKTVPISSVVVGDKVCVGARDGRLKFSEVYLIAHYDPEVETEFLKIEFTSPSTGLTESVILSPDHHILTNDRFDFARNVQPYLTQLQVLNGFQMVPVRVANVNTETHKGYIAIFTRAGTLVADNVMCSCYASVAPHQSTINTFLSPLMISTKLKKSGHDGKDIHPYLRFLYSGYKGVNSVVKKVTGKGGSYQENR